jgi:hypothetical protein
MLSILSVLACSFLSGRQLPQDIYRSIRLQAAVTVRDEFPSVGYHDHLLRSAARR